MGVVACQTDARFPEEHKHAPKAKYWESTLEDALDVCAKVSRIAAIVFHNCYKDNKNIPEVDPSLDYAANFSN